MKSGWIFLILVACMQSFISCKAQEIPDCTDPLANNFDPDATINDGSCTYFPVSVSPKQTISLSDQIKRTSGLIIWDGNLWTHNDHQDINLYGLDTITADIERMYPLTGVINFDWEEISQDQGYIYLGDFGNNTGDRTDLHILRIKKSSLIVGDADIDTIWFSYEDQTDFSVKEAYQTDFDCEAMIVSDDSIYLFTKQWISVQTSVYRLPKIPGNFTALKKATYNVQGLVTGATYLENKHLVVLCGYTSLLHPFLTLLYDFQGHDFFSGNKRRITVSLPFHQIEGITTQNGIRYYISNESFSLQQVTYSPQKLHLFDLSPLLEEYLASISSDIETRQIHETVRIYPNPVNRYLTVEIKQEIRPAVYRIYDQSARMILHGMLTDEFSDLDITRFAAGHYTLTIGDHCENIFKIMKAQ